MKKIIVMLLTLCASVVNATADNTVSVSTALIPQGKTGSFSIELTNTDAFASSMEVHLTLPEGITFESVSPGDRFTDNPNVGNTINGQSVTITTFSSKNEAITGNSGALLIVTVSADAALEVGTKLTASITKMELAKKVGEGHEKFNPDPFDFEIEITDRVILDENSSVAPTAQSDVNVLVKRTIKKDTWSTIVLPFAIAKSKVSDLFGSDVKIAEFTSFETDYGDDETNMVPLGIIINFKEYTTSSLPRAGMTAGKPYLINVSDDINSFELDGVNIISSVNDAVKDDEVNGLSGKMTGSFVKTTIPEFGLFLSNDQFWYSTGKTKVKAFRGWFELDAVLGKETFSVKMCIDGAETGIETLYAQPSTEDTYDLSGRKIEKPQQRGIYIVNGKKMLKY